MKTIVIKFKKVGTSKPPYTILDDLGNTIATDVTKKSLLEGVNYIVEDEVSFITINSEEGCNLSKTVPVVTYDPNLIKETIPDISKTSCSWRHLTNPTIYNFFYGNIEPYIIEYPFSYEYNDQIMQSVKDYTKVYKYLPEEESVFDDVRRIELDDSYFNKAVLYNNQQSSGILELHPKPVNNLKLRMSYPIYGEESKSIIYTKSDNFYQYNTFWSIAVNTTVPLFVKSCKSMSIDKEVNQNNMDYSLRSYKKGTIRAKDLRIRHILDNRSDIHLVSQFIVNYTQISYK